MFQDGDGNDDLIIGAYGADGGGYNSGEAYLMTAADFAAADAIRDQLAAAGVTIEDSPSGTRWRRSG